MPIPVYVNAGDTLKDNDPRLPCRYLTVLTVNGARVVGYPRGEPSKPHVRIALDHIHPLGAKIGWSIVPKNHGTGK